MQKRHHYLGAITGGDAQASSLCSAIVARRPSDVRVPHCAGWKTETQQFARRQHLSGLQCSSLRATAAARINATIVCPRMTTDLNGTFFMSLKNIKFKSQHDQVLQVWLFPSIYFISINAQYLFCFFSSICSRPKTSQYSMNASQDNQSVSQSVAMLWVTMQTGQQLAPN